MAESQETKNEAGVTGDVQPQSGSEPTSDFTSTEAVVGAISADQTTNIKVSVAGEGASQGVKQNCPSGTSSHDFTVSGAISASKVLEVKVERTDEGPKVVPPAKESSTED